MNIDDIMRQFKEASETPATSLEFNEDGESLSTLYEAPWVRILLIRKRTNPKGSRLEIEISPPSADARSECGCGMKQNSGEIREITRKRILDLASNVEYMLRLHDAGFILDMAGSECTWTACGIFRRIPSRSLFELITPP